MKKDYYRNVLKRQVKEWDALPSCDLPFFAPFYYIPKSEKDIHDSLAIKIRNMILNFKVGVETSTKDHEQALRFVIAPIARILKMTFKRNVSDLTLVCVPASTSAKTLRRYYQFSKRLCEKVGMEQSFNHIKVTSSKDTQPKHFGGKHLNMDNIKFDKSFFKGKDVVLFDDIVTSGYNMKLMKEALEGMGANVICALAMGYTQHELTMHPIQFDRFKKYQLK